MQKKLVKKAKNKNSQKEKNFKKKEQQSVPQKLLIKFKKIQKSSQKNGNQKRNMKILNKDMMKN